MAAAFRYARAPLSQLARYQYADFNVFQLMRLLLRNQGGRNWPTGQRLRFRAELDAAFQGREITRLGAEDKPKTASGNLPERIVLHTPNYCVASELGPLPAPFLEWVREQQRDGAPAMSAFFNLFNQRIHVLRYELKQRSLRALDPALPDNTRYAEQLAALIGLAQNDAQKQIPLPRRAWLGLAGLLVNNRRSAEVVTIVMSRFLGVRVHLQTLAGAWRDIETSELLVLGRRNHRLGQSSLLGSHMWDRQAGVRLEVARLRFDQVLALLPLHASPAGESLPPSRHADCSSLIQLLLDRRYDCAVEIKVETATIPLSRLSPGIGLRLGQTAWLISRAEGETEHLDSLVRFRVAAYENEHARMAA